MLCEIDPKVDFAFKRLFGDPRNIELPKSLINSAFENSGLTPIVELTIVNPFNLKDTPTDKMSILDIKAKDESGRQINLEMQMLGHQSLRSRIVFYLTELHSTQLREGDDYGKLCPTISLLFVNEILFPETDQVHHRFRLCDPQSGLVFSDQVEIHVIELAKLPKAESDLTNNLEQWIYFFMNAKGLDMAALPGGLTVPEIKKALSELTRMNGTREERIRYIERETALRDMLTWHNDVARANEQLAQTNEQLAQTKEQMAQTKEQMAQANDRVAEVNEQLAEVTEQAEKAQAELARVESKLAKSENQKAQTDADLTKLSEELAETRRQMAEMERRYGKPNN
jgi:predicted transposase/invertase (TIGR01784 family)